MTAENSRFPLEATKELAEKAWNLGKQAGAKSPARGTVSKAQEADIQLLYAHMPNMNAVELERAHKTVLAISRGQRTYQACPIFTVEQKMRAKANQKELSAAKAA